MADQAYKNAAAKVKSLDQKISSLKQELEESQREMARAENFIRDWRVFAGIDSDSASAHESDSVNNISERPPEKRTNPSKQRIANAAESLISARGQPIQRSVLFRALADQGLELTGKDPENDSQHDVVEVER